MKVSTDCVGGIWSVMLQSNCRLDMNVSTDCVGGISTCLNVS
jgi:hypothetical protein